MRMLTAAAEYRTDPNDLSSSGPQERCMTDVKGFFYPRTASGRSSLIPSPPWYYSGDLLTVEYRTDPARVAELLPAPLSPGGGGPRGRCLDLGRLAVVLILPRRAAGSSARAIQRGLRRRPLQLRRSDILALCLHLGRQGLRDWPRDSPGLPEEARFHVADPAAPIPARCTSDRRLAECLVQRSRPATGASRKRC